MAHVSEINGPDDFLIVKSDKGTFQLNRTNLKENLLELKSQVQVSIKELSTEYAESFRSIVDALRLLYSSDESYKLVLGDIHYVFNDVKEIKPGTVGAFFMGCFTDEKFNGSVGCSPKCTSSLPPSQGTTGYKQCDDLVVIYADGLFKSLNDKRSPHAYIYIEDEYFKGFTPANIQDLKAENIENVSLIFGNKDGSYRDVTSVLALDKLPLINKNSQPLKYNAQYVTFTTDNNTTDSSNAGGIVFLVILCVLIVLVALFLWMLYKGKI